jgi:molybdenum ABC transporter molybdate-binding protein
MGMTSVRKQINMKRLMLLLFLFTAICLGGCSRRSEPVRQQAELRVLCGSSMAAPAQEAGQLFQAQHRIKVMFDLGGSETLLPRILAGAPGDIFICHDPFELKVKEAGQWAGSVRVGVLQPVLLVRPGNPLKISSLTNLTQPNLKLGIGDPRYSTCGDLFVKQLEKQGLRDLVMKQVVLQGRSHSEIANGLILGPLDAVVVWNFVAKLYGDKVLQVPTKDAYPEINVTVLGLKSSPNPHGRDAFLEFCKSQPVQDLFAQHGYRPTPP